MKLHQNQSIDDELVPTDGLIRVRGARVHNLRDIDVDIPHEALVVITGISGSGKSSLAFDTIFAEGQRRYLESLSTYTRQFLDQMQRPDVDSIEGLPPTISIDQRASTAHQRSTLATTTEIYDYLRLLYARAGQAHCTSCGRAVTQQSPQAIVDRILAEDDRRKVMILAPLVAGRKGTHRDVFETICKQGFVRARVDGEIADATDPPTLARGKPHDIDVVIDRIITKPGIRARLQESVDLALKHGNGSCLVSCQQADAWHDQLYSSRFACPGCGISFTELEPRTFSFNSPYGACPECKGLGYQVDSEADKPRAKNESAGIDSAAVCPACTGTRLGPVARSVTVAGKAIHELTAMNVAAAGAFVDEILTSVEWESECAVLTFSAEARLAAKNTLPDVASRLRFLNRIGLHYLTLNRETRTLSGGEFQRARLAASLGSGLTGICYVLDEPTLGLHARDTGRMIAMLRELRDQGNSIVVVEHDEDVMRSADHLIDLGPGAGREGGRVVAAGRPDDVARNENSLTGRLLSKRSDDAPPRDCRPIDWTRSIKLTGARLHNLQEVTAEIPLDVLTVVTGVSGSGKTSLIMQTLAPAVRRCLTVKPANAAEPTSDGYSQSFDKIVGVESIERIVEIDQSPIGRTGRSNPATYAKIWDEIRKLFAKTRDARIRGYKSRRFSFNSRDGRCEECRGQGNKRIEMHFLPEMFVECASCRGARFNRPTLAIRFRGKSVADVLEMRIDEAAEFFENFPRLHKILTTFADVGLGYLCLGQSSLTLSGGEAQRVKLATELSRSSQERTLFVLDEPTVGLHPADVARLIDVLQRLIDQQHSVLVVEHQLDLIAAADWVIDIGPDGGDQGGTVVAAGAPNELVGIGVSHTGIALKQHLRPGDE